MGLKSFLRNEWDRVGAWVFVALGAVSLLVGWLGVSSTSYLSEQVPYVVSGGMTGLFLLGLGAMLWLSADLRDEWRKLDAIQRDMRREAQVPGDVGVEVNDTIEVAEERGSNRTLSGVQGAPAGGQRAAR